MNIGFMSGFFRSCNKRNGLATIYGHATNQSVREKRYTTVQDDGFRPMRRCRQVNAVIDIICARRVIHKHNEAPDADKKNSSSIKKVALLLRDSLVLATQVQYLAYLFKEKHND